MRLLQRYDGAIVEEFPPRLFSISTFLLEHYVFYLTRPSLRFIRRFLEFLIISFFLTTDVAVDNEMAMNLRTVSSNDNVIPCLSIEMDKLENSWKNDDCIAGGSIGS